MASIRASVVEKNGAGQDQGDDQMNENDDDVAHRGILPKPPKLPEFGPIW
jgi:hypothetical protein